MDYESNTVTKRFYNKGIIIIPRRWRSRRVTFGTTKKYFGKTYPSNTETQEMRGFNFKGSPVVWLFDGHRIGKFGLCICYDLMDLERLTLYRGRIQHLFVLAYNRDLTSFQHIAEASARLLFCNVVICNTGFYGGSLAIAPYYEPIKRTIFQQSGANLFTSQSFDLEVRSLAMHQQGRSKSDDKRWKSLPAGFGGQHSLKVQETDLAQFVSAAPKRQRSRSQ